MDTSCVDEDGTPDVYRNLINKLRRHGTIDQGIEEPLSPDWRAEQETLPGLLRSLREKEQWVPRTGEIVLYVRDLPDDIHITRDGITKEFQLYNERSGKYLGSPHWEAGLVGQTPMEAPTNSNVIYSGLRVEPIAHPNSLDKSVSKRYKYVSARQTRPLLFWYELLHNIRREDWHASVVNALTLTSTLSLMGKYRFRGAWPDATIYCHGLYLGFEMLAVGDTVRLLPSARSGQVECTDIMVIRSVRLKWLSLGDASNNDYDNDGKPYKSEIWVYGSAYTSEPSRSDKQWLCDQNIELPRAAGDYANWYPLHPASKELAVPFSRILGRLYERHAMAAFLNSGLDEMSDLDAGREGLMEAREFSTQHDERIAREKSATWYWGDSRADALDLHTINGLDVAKYDQERNMKDLRKQIKLVDGLADEKASTHRGIPTTGFGGIDLRSFTAPEMSVLPVRTQRAQEATASSSASDSLSSGHGPTVGRKRSHTIDIDANEDDQEIRQSTKIIEHGPSVTTTTNKKAKVSVVID